MKKKQKRGRPRPHQWDSKIQREIDERPINPEQAESDKRAIDESLRGTSAK